MNIAVATLTSLLINGRMCPDNAMPLSRYQKNDSSINKTRRRLKRRIMFRGYRIFSKALRKYTTLVGSRPTRLLPRPCIEETSQLLFFGLQRKLPTRGLYHVVPCLQRKLP